MNISKRGICPFEPAEDLWRLASDNVAQDRMEIRSCIDVIRNHGRSTIDIMHDLILGNPWRPPVQVFSP